MILGPYTFLIILSSLIILSYLFDMVAKRSKIPSVILLLTTGILLQVTATAFEVRLPGIRSILELFGIIGLILIVLEGALDLELSRDKLPLIRKTLLTATLTLLITAALIGWFINFWLNVPYQMAIINSIPLAVISSAIAIPSVTNLTPEKREFIVYEATFSDIIGIIAFNFAVQNNQIGVGSFVTLAVDLVSIFIISIICCLILLFFIDKIKSHIKFFLIIAILILLYSVGKEMHLSSLLMVLCFGLMLNNAALFIKDRLARYISLSSLEAEIKQLKQINGESAFVIRTFFFLLFGFSINLQELLDLNVWVLGFTIFSIILLVRYLYLQYIARVPLIPELFVAPRGLITILLFYSIPAQFQIPGMNESVLFFVVILSSLLMMLGLMLTRNAVDDIPNY
ncbi:cation:proton antiporter [Rufibacter quisquiliarum]|uniref:NhaP-type Na+/H+ or K+/H+ antiporter n=1 Tax=Rufibacter quisquiliarum TaxID=1549639 RepID=A0A839GFL0_9BACT|nr:cation:proton antiporter [Rufibacter quisquiliarum]MBA9077682.1 NhaP-type Na+/H+ or K+/H+ antiporter [Rufibacter quisquiliarum]